MMWVLASSPAAPTTAVSREGAAPPLPPRPPTASDRAALICQEEGRQGAARRASVCIACLASAGAPVREAGRRRATGPPLLGGSPACPRRRPAASQPVRRPGAPAAGCATRPGLGLAAGRHELPCWGAGIAGAGIAGGGRGWCRPPSSSQHTTQRRKRQWRHCRHVKPSRRAGGAAAAAAAQAGRGPANRGRLPSVSSLRLGPSLTERRSAPARRRLVEVHALIVREPGAPDPARLVSPGASGAAAIGARGAAGRLRAGDRAAAAADALAAPFAAFAASRSGCRGWGLGGGRAARRPAPRGRAYKRGPASRCSPSLFGTIRVNIIRRCSREHHGWAARSGAGR